MKPTVGRIVHYVLDRGRGKGEHRPAIVVNDWAGLHEVIQLQVLTDGTNDGDEFATGIAWRTSVHQDEEKKAPGTWHWPEREEEQKAK